MLLHWVRATIESEPTMNCTNIDLISSKRNQVFSAAEDLPLLCSDRIIPRLGHVQK